jgi:hypothetical protein
MADSTLKEKKSIIQKYGDFGSDVYAPLQREGRFPDSKPSGKEIEPEPFVPRTLNALYDLENSAPIRKLEVCMQTIRHPPSFSPQTARKVLSE